MSFLWYLSIFSKIWLNITSHSSLLRKLRERVCHPNVTKLLFCSLSFKWSRNFYSLDKNKKIRIDSDQSTSINKISPPFNKLQKIISTKFLRTFYLQCHQKQKNIFRSKIFRVFTKTPVLICQCKYNISSNIMDNLLVLIYKFISISWSLLVILSSLYLNISRTTRISTSNTKPWSTLFSKYSKFSMSFLNIFSNRLLFDSFNIVCHMFSLEIMFRIFVALINLTTFMTKL